MRAVLFACLLIGLSGLEGCRRDGTLDGDGGAPPSATVSRASSLITDTAKRDAVVDPSVPSRPSPTPGEAERHVVASGEHDPLLRPYATRVRNHFKDGRAPFSVQRASLLGGGSAILVRQEGETSPLMLVEDRERKLLWEREKPTIAMLPPVRDPVIVGRSTGGVALFAYDVPARVVAGRLIDADGTPFADLTVMRVDDCQWLSAAHWPKRGIVVVCARANDNRMQIIRPDHTLALAPEGVVVGRAARSPTPISVGFDSDDSMMLAQFAKAKDGRDHALVFRYDASGTAKWPSPFDLDANAPERSVAERIAMTPRPGGVRLQGLADIDSNGAVVR